MLLTTTEEGTSSNELWVRCRKLGDRVYQLANDISAAEFADLPTAQLRAELRHAEQAFDHAWRAYRRCPQPVTYYLD